MRPQLRSSTEYRRRSSINASVDPLSAADPARRRSVNSAHTCQDGNLRRLSLAANSHGDPKYCTDSPVQSPFGVKSISGIGSPLALSNIILRRGSLPTRVNLSTRSLDRRQSSGRSVDPSKQDLNMYRLRVLIVCFFVIFVIGMLMLFFRSSSN